MKTLRALLFVGASAWISPASAAEAVSAAGGGSEAGNGGSAIVCRNSAGEVQSVELLDFFEGRQIFGFKPELGPAELTPEQKVELFLERLTRKGFSRHSRSEFFLDWARKVLRDSTRFYSGTRLVEVPDSASLILPAQCAQEQIAVQRKKLFEGESVFNINRDLWDHPSFDSDQKAGLLLHELFYFLALNASLYEAPAEPLRDSRGIRHFVAKYSDSSRQGTLKELARDFVSIRFGLIETRGYTCRVGEGLEFDSPDEIRACETEPFEFELMGETRYGKGVRFFAGDSRPVAYRLSSTESFVIGGRLLWFPADEWLTLYAAGAIHEGVIAYDEDLRFSVPGEMELRLSGGPSDRIGVSFRFDGTLSGCQSCRGTVTIGGRAIPVAPATGSEDVESWSVREIGFPDHYSEYRLDGEASYPLGGREAWFMERLTLNVYGAVRHATLSRPYAAELRGMPYAIIGSVTATAEGKPEYAVLAASATLPGCDGGSKKYLKNMRLRISSEKDCVMDVIAAFH